MFESTVYVKVWKNRLWARHIENALSGEVTVTKPFTTTRLLVGEFSVAEAALKALVIRVSKTGLFSISPEVLIHPMEMVENGLSEVEERAFLELAYGSGARKAKVYVGMELSDDGVRTRLVAK